MLTCLFAGKKSFAQHWEVGAFIGSSNYLGDLAPDVTLKESHLALGFNVRQNLSPFFSLNYGLNYGTISGNDNNFSHLAKRNLNFNSPITEGSIQLEFNFFRYILGMRTKKYTPYVSTGLSVYTWDPKTTFNENTVSLRRVGTEGQGLIEGAPKKYGKYGVAVPITAGFKFRLQTRVSLSVFSSYRASFNDYLDDVGGVYPDKDVLIQKKNELGARLSDRSGELTNEYFGYKGRMRGNPDNKDWYIFSGFIFNFLIADPNCPSDFR